MNDIEYIIKTAENYLKVCDKELIYKAYLYAKEAHSDQKRLSGDDYITHPLSSTKILLDLRPDIDTICASLLHDIPEETDKTIDDIRKNFNPDITNLVAGFTKLSKIHPLDENIEVDNLRKMFLSIAKDLRVVLIKFADRIHNLRTLQYVPKEKQKRIAKESMEIYAGIASRLGIYSIKTEMEDICFKYLYPKEYLDIKKQMDEYSKERLKFINIIKSKLQKVFIREGIKAEITSRIKHLYSIYKKLKKKNKNFINEIYDIVAFRVILDDNIKNKLYDDSICYKTLGIIHKYFTPLNHRFKDYIALPKDNGYKSLHTTVIGLGGKEFSQPTEIQIRTKRMHFEAEFGIAAHFEYKENNNDKTISGKKKEWVKNLISLHQEWHSNEEFLENLKIDIFKDRIFVLTPGGDVKDLPNGATPIDFAYAIHSDIGHRFKGAIVNGNIVPLDYKLKNGDIVRINTGKESKPNLYWLTSIVTNQAKQKIKSWFKSKDKDHLIKEGKDLINKQLKRFGYNELTPNLSQIDGIFGKKITLKERLEILEQVGNGAMSPTVIVKKIIDKPKIKIKFPKKKPKTNICEILIKGEKGYETRIAGCCNPDTEKEIIAYITKSQGISVHSKKCKFISNVPDKNNLIEAEWSCNIKDSYMITVEGNNLKDIMDTINPYQIKIKSIETNDNNIVKIDIKNTNFFTISKIIDKLESLDSIVRVIKE